MSSPVRTVSSPQQAKRRGRHSAIPRTELGAFIQRRLDAIGMTRAEMAKQLHVSPSTISRLLNGDTRVVQRVSYEAICTVLALDDMDRRSFLKLVGVATTESFAFPTGANAPKSPRYGVDLDLAHDHADALSRLIDRGDTKYVYESAQHWYTRLAQEQPSAKDERFAAVQIRFGILFGAAQELTLPWYQRSVAAIRTFNRVEEEVILRFHLNAFPDQYANLLSHRAPLYREIGQYDESTRHFEYGIYWVKQVDDPELRANLYRSRMHVSAVQGNELRWSRELEEARKDLQYLAICYKQLDEMLIRSRIMLDYAEGEGYKRFAFNPRKELLIQKRRAYALQALDCFKQSYDVGLPFAHLLLLAVSEAQCLVWLDPEESIRRLEGIWHEVELAFPALLDKMRRTLQFARIRLQAHQHDPLPVFNLDVKRK